MTLNDQDDFFNMLTGVCELYGKLASPEFMALYWQLLAGYELQDIQRAFHAHALNADVGQYMPKPSDVVRYIDGGSQTRSARAWVKVDKALRSVGGWDSVVFDDPLIHAALEGLGQWPELCATPADEIQFLRARFEKRYQALVVNPPVVWPRSLVGRSELENVRAGYAPALPVPVGDLGQCKLTYGGGVDSSQSVTIHAIGAVIQRDLARLGERPALRIVAGGVA